MGQTSVEDENVNVPNATPLKRVLKRRVALPIWALALGAVLLAGIVGAAASGSSALDTARADEAEERAQQAERRADAERRRAADAEDKAREKVRAEFAAKEREIDNRTAELRQREAAVGAAEQAAEANQFGDGVHEIGTDIQPGKYKTDGGERCYWEKTAADGEIDANDNPGGPTTVIISPGPLTFKSSLCGTWTKVG